MKIVDGGYLAWQYGTTPGMHNGWAIAKAPYMRKNGTLILLDSSRSLRKEHDPHYKSRRAEKREDPEKLEKYEQVHRFIDEFIKPDPTLETITLDGLEADDLVAMIVAFKLITLPIRITGIDKDLLQLPRGTCVVEQTENRSTVEHFASRLPKAAQPFVKEPRDVLLSLCILGDKSDSIDRLLPVRRYDIWEMIMTDKSPFDKAYETFGNAFLNNLYLAILPGPWCYNPVPTPGAVFEAVKSGRWYNLPQNKSMVDKLSVAISNVTEVANESDW